MHTEETINSITILQILESHLSLCVGRSRPRTSRRCQNTVEIRKFTSNVFFLKPQSIFPKYVLNFHEDYDIHETSNVFYHTRILQ